MFKIRKAAAALCLSGLVIGGTATAAFASTASASRAAAPAQSAQVVGTWCGYQVVRAPNGLFVRSGPSTRYRVVGGLADHQRTTGDCTSMGAWIHLSNKYNHYHSPSSARGWSDGYYLSKTAKTTTMYWCGYRVYQAPNGLYVRTGPGRTYRVIGGLANGQRTTGSCGTVRGWVHLSSKYNHYHSPKNARGWSDGRYLRK
jgi:uncharacterized protein YgiM (DUF1202 family)